MGHKWASTKEFRENGQQMQIISETEATGQQVQETLETIGKQMENTSDTMGDNWKTQINRNVQIRKQKTNG